MSSINIPIPPLDMRRMVGPTDPSEFDNPSGAQAYAEWELQLPLDAYESVFDFGCGCGRMARRLLQQIPKPRRYVGVDAHRGMLDWCKQNLSPIDPNFQFFHHDVYSPGYAPGNSLRLAESFPVRDEEFSLLIAHSIFTHLCRQQTEYYLGEVSRILQPRGLAITTWFFFDRDSFPFFREGPYCLYTSEKDFAEAVIYDRKWFLDTVRRLGLAVRSTIPPGVAGQQWIVLLAKRTPDTVDQFPLGEEGAEWLCGATLKPIATPAWPTEAIEKGKVGPTIEEGKSVLSDSHTMPERPQPPSLFGALAELEEMRRKLDLKQPSMSRIEGEATSLVRKLKRFLLP